MNHREMLALLHRLKGGEITAEDLIGRLERDSFQELGFAKPDHQRTRRLGFPEVVFAEGKQDAHLLEICQVLQDAHPQLLVTRLNPEQAETLTAAAAGLSFADASSRMVGTLGSAGRRLNA